MTRQRFLLNQIVNCIIYFQAIQKMLTKHRMIHVFVFTTPSGFIALSRLSSLGHAEHGEQLSAILSTEPIEANVNKPIMS